MWFYGETPFGYDPPTIKMDGLIAFQVGNLKDGTAHQNCQRTINVRQTL